MTDKKKKTVRRKPPVILIVLMLVTCIAVSAAVIVNIFGILRTQEPEPDTVPAAEKNSRSMRNDYYEIGNNPTDLEKEEFQKLTDAVNSGTDAEKAEACARNFVADHFTWTNKDGNYEIGGIQYVYGEKASGFETWSRHNFYDDLDLYITQYGRDKLIEVASITTTSVKEAPDFVYERWLDTGVSENISFKCYEVNLAWTYADNCTITEQFPNEGRFFVIYNTVRYEIAEFYDMDSIREWEAQNS